MNLFINRKDEKLFKLFRESVAIVVKGGDILHSVTNDYVDLDIKLACLTAMGHEKDRIIEKLIQRLNSSFVLPIDREDAFLLVQQLAATLNFIIEIIERMVLYKTGRPDDTIKKMVDILYESLLLEEKAFNLLNRIEPNVKNIIECCQKIDQLEREQDIMYRNGLAVLFSQYEDDPLSIIKWREIYEHIETAQDHIQEVAELIGNICVKYS